MKLHLTRPRFVMTGLGAMVILGLAALIVVIAALPPASSARLPLPKHAAATPVPLPAPQIVGRENTRIGTTDWELAPQSNLDLLQGYAGQVSVLPGQSVTLYVSAQLPMLYSIGVYRIGWYQGKGAYRYFEKDQLHGMTQGVWDKKNGLVQCPTCTIDPVTHLVDAHWQPSFVLVVGDTWPTGMYLIKLSGEHQAQSYIPLVVRDDHAATPVLVSFPVTTYQAYNIWGGYSLYDREDLEGNLFAQQRAVKVSFNRPYDDRAAGTGDFLNWDLHTLRWLESKGIDASYTTSIDVAANPALLLQHRAYIALGHDEYWTKSMRDGLELARNRGVSEAYLGADDGDWQMRLEPDQALTLNRVEVCYKVSTRSQTPTEMLSNDPAYPAHKDVVTTNWRDPLLNRPESLLLGLQYRSLFGKNYYPDWVVTTAPLPKLAEGTGLVPGMHIKGGLLGYESDTLAAPNATPPGLVVLAKSPITDTYGRTALAYTAYYYAASGALVFDAGTIWWAWGLDGSTAYGTSQTNILKGNTLIQRLTYNIIKAMLAASPHAPG